MSILAILIIVILFVCETWAFLHTKIVSTIDIDPNLDNLVRLNFNVTLYDVQCDFVSVGEYIYVCADLLCSAGNQQTQNLVSHNIPSTFLLLILKMCFGHYVETKMKQQNTIINTNSLINNISIISDVWDKLGTNLQNVTKDITKWNLDQEGTQKKFHGRNKHERAVVHEEHEETMQDIADLNDGDLHAVDLSAESLEKFHEDNPIAIVDFFAPVSSASVRISTYSKVCLT